LPFPAAWYSDSVKLASIVLTWLGVAVTTATGCGGMTNGRELTEPVVTVVPDEFVVRDVRKDAARKLACQVPAVEAEIDGWAGAEGNVIAFGCGYRVTYYLRCMTSHQCTIKPFD